MSRYFLSAQAFVCLTENGAVFLDLKRNSYTLVPGWSAEKAKEARPMEVEPVILSIGAPRIAPRLKIIHVVHFIAAWLSATFMLRHWPIERIVQRARKRKGGFERGFEQLDPSALQSLIAAYFRLQRYAFDARDACLRNSLTLAEFLALQGLYPTWVFGVKTAPFAAHCWLQAGPIVLNDSAPHVRGYTPIMAV